MNILYTAVATATGEGRDGSVRTPDGLIDTALAIPEELGGRGGATNPEQLFAAGYAACFHSALRRVARQAEADVTGSQVTAHVGLGKSGPSYGLAVTLEVSLPQLDEQAARDLVEAAHQICPYSNATRGNIDVKLVLS